MLLVIFSVLMVAVLLYFAFPSVPSKEELDEVREEYKEFEKEADELAKKYGLTKEDVLRSIGI